MIWSFVSNIYKRIIRWPNPKSQSKSRGPLNQTIMKKIDYLKIAICLAISATTAFAQSISSGSGGAISANTTAVNQNVGIGTTNPIAALHLFTGSNVGMLSPRFILERNDQTNQAGLLTIGLSSNGFASGLLGGGSAYFKLEDPFGNSPNSDIGFSTNGNAAQFVIKHNGFVGVGTELPTANFHALGTARFENLPTSTSNTDIVTSDANGNFALTNASVLFPTNTNGWNVVGSATTTSLEVGIGTTTPSNAALHLVTGTNTGMLPPNIKLDRNDGTNQAGVLSVGISSNGFTTGQLGGGSAYFKLEDPYGNSQNSDMGFSTNGNAAQLVIKHNGFVGIGTETPSANFHSIGTARMENLPNSSSNTTVITTDASGNLALSNAASLFTNAGWNLNGNATASTDFIGTTNTNPLNFAVNNIKSMSLDNGGNVSISTGGISSYQKLYVETAKQNDGIMVNQTGNTAATLDLNASGGGGKRWSLHSTGNGNNQGAGHLLFWDWTNNQEQMRIDSNGRIVMGNVTTPAGYKLYVQEGILTEKIKVAIASSAAWADYVFEDDYKLTPLNEVARFIEENNHLPNIPSAEELEKEGIDLAQMQALQMAKIEELTLYLIEMKKEIEILKEVNQKLTSATINRKN